MENKKKFSVVKFILILIPVVLIGGIAAVVISLNTSYNNNAYEEAEIVEREDEYVMPDYPDDIIIADNTDESFLTDNYVENPDIPAVTEEEETEETQSAVEEEVAPETTAPEDEAAEAAETLETTESEQKTEKEEEVQTAAQQTESQQTESQQTATEQTAIEQTEAQQTEAQQTEAQSVTAATSTGEALPSTVNSGTTTEVTYNTSASFANSANAVSVYGKTPIYKVTQKDSDIVNILIMGTDTRDVTVFRGNSDTMIVFSYNKKTGSVKLTTFMRDSLVPIEGRGWNRLNSAYAYDGAGLIVNTINQLFGLDIQQFVVIDFNGTKNFIDYVGGVDVNLTQEEVDYYNGRGYNFTVGYNHLNASQALMHMRNRTIGYDFGRTSRQRDVLTTMIKTIFTQKSVTEIYDILNYAFTLVKTNISSADLASLALSVATNASKLSISSQQVPYSDSYQNAWYNGMQVLSFDISSTATRVRSFIYN